MERKCVMVAFGDILGFGVWSRRAANPPEVRDPFIVTFYGEIERFLTSYPDVYAKFLGDGFMIVKELPEKGHKCFAVIKLMRDLAALTRRLTTIVKNCGDPPPTGFRLRIATGYCTKFSVTDPNDRKRKVAEYVAYVINLAQRLLEVSPEIALLCTEGTVKILGRKKHGFRIRRLVGTKQIPRGVDPEDIEGLRIVEF